MPRIAPPLSIDLSLPISQQPAYLRATEAAAYLRRDIRTLRNWEARGLIKVHRPCGGYPLIPRSEVERILSEGA
jgi:excisionase family DNA binding protein